MSTTLCPYCNKLISLYLPLHNCLETLDSDDYVDEENYLRLLWTPAQGWQSYSRYGDDWEPVEKLAFDKVVEWVNDKEYHFKPIG